jgi:hypothetical protein
MQVSPVAPPQCRGGQQSAFSAQWMPAPAEAGMQHAPVPEHTNPEQHWKSAPHVAPGLLTLFDAVGMQHTLEPVSQMPVRQHMLAPQFCPRSKQPASGGLQVWSG